MKKWPNLSFKNFHNSITLIFLILILISATFIIASLIDFFLNQNLLNFIIVISILIFLIIGITSFTFLIIRKDESELDIFNKNKIISSLIITIVIIIFITITIVSKQYGLSICIAIIFVGYLLGFLISLKITKKNQNASYIIITLITASISIPLGFFARGTLNSRKNSQVWKMHTIDNPGFILPNGLDTADVNGDGYLDYLTNYEWDGKVRIAFHPGLLYVKKPWPAITIGSVDNAESAALGDFDGDGNFDAVVAHGTELFSDSGLLFIWGPNRSDSMEGSAWKQSKDIDVTRNKGHFHYVKGYDINRDNLTDIVVGGRGTNPRAGLKWIEAPISGNCRNLSDWRIHNIDANIESGHGFVFGDIDNDGDDDITLCNADWDTPNSKEKIVWYENSGPINFSQLGPWPKHIVYQGSEFYSKEQVVLYDFTGDNFPEIIMQTKNDIYFFKNPQNLSSWELIIVKKAPETQWRARLIKIKDINNDTKPDILGMLIHHDGNLPNRKAAVFWMEYTSLNPFSGVWQTHVIKWGDNFIGIGKYNGEKWDQCLFEDIDRDGDVDIIANCEEFNTFGFVYISVVWFENPII